MSEYDTQRAYRMQTNGHVDPAQTDMKPHLIRAQNSHLWRIVYADGTVSDMVNESRAKDALLKLEEAAKKVKQ